MKIGFGYDVHRLSENRALILCGVKIPFKLGLLGHSDADVAIHALMDAMLGALSLGDIGTLFPDSDEAYLNADSMELMERVYEKIGECGYEINNCDITIIAQQPKIKPYVHEMREGIAQALCCDIDLVSVKATTEEYLGFTGNLSGIKAVAVCSLEKKE